jgi:hypothetical protein
MRPPILDPKTNPDVKVIKLVASMLGAQLRTKAMDIEVAERIAIIDTSMLLGRDCFRFLRSWSSLPSVSSALILVFARRELRINSVDSCSVG